MRLFPVRLLVLIVVVSVDLHAQEFAPKVSQLDPILLAARAGKLDAITKLLDDGGSVNACDGVGNTPVTVALLYGHVDLARDLLHRGFDPHLVYRAFGNREIIEIGSAVLAFAAKDGAEDIVDQMLAEGITAYPTLYALDQFAGSPILHAIHAKHAGILRKLLEHTGRDGREKTRRASYAYLSACESLELIDVLVDYGADVNAADGTGPFPHVLHTYAKRGWKEGVARIIQLGADATERDGNKKLPEETCESPEIKRLLQLAALSTHADRAGPVVADEAPGELVAVPRKTNSAQPSPQFPIEVIAAAMTGSEPAAIELLKNLSAAELNVPDDRGWTVLIYALRGNYRRLANALIDAGADVAQLTQAGSSTLAFATETHDVDLVKKIVAKGAEVDAAENGSATALLMAVQARDLPVVETLLTLHASVEPPRPDNHEVQWKDALMVAAKTGDILLMERILKAGANLQAVDSSGEGVVFYAVRSRNVAALDWLVKHGAYARQETNRGTNALTLAASLGAVEMCRALTELGVSHRDAKAYAETSGNMETVVFFRELEKQSNPADIHLWERSDTTTDDVHRYIEAGGDVNYAYGAETPLQHMAFLGNAEAVALLLEKGADPKRVGRESNLPAFLALNNVDQRTDEKALTILCAFIEHGVSPNSQDYLVGLTREKTPTGMTLLACAITANYWRCARYLLEHGANPTLRSSYPDEDAFDALAHNKTLTEIERFEFRKFMEGCARTVAASQASETPTSPQPKQATF